MAVRDDFQTPPESPAPEGESSGGARLWLASATVMAGLHAGALATTLLWQPSHEPSIPPGAMMIELAAAEPPVPAPPPPSPPQPLRPPEKVVPELPKPPPVKKAEVALPKPKPKPKVASPPDATPMPAEKVREDDTPAPVATPAAQTARALAPAPAPSLDAIPNWHGALRAHLERHKRYPAAAQFRRQQGVPMVRFVMDRNGTVLSAQLERSCGHNSLDQEALALLERAQPLPPPPPEVADDPVEVRVPVQFFLR